MGLRLRIGIVRRGLRIVHRPAYISPCSRGVHPFLCGVRNAAPPTYTPTLLSSEVPLNSEILGHCCCWMLNYLCGAIILHIMLAIGKGKCIYIALIFVVHARRSGMDHTVLPPMPAFTS